MNSIAIFGKSDMFVGETITSFSSRQISVPHNRSLYVLDGPDTVYKNHLVDVWNGSENSYENIANSLQYEARVYTSYDIAWTV